VCQLVEFFAGSRVEDYTPLLELVSRLAAPPFLTGVKHACHLSPLFVGMSGAFSAAEQGALPG